MTDPIRIKGFVQQVPHEAAWGLLWAGEQMLEPAAVNCTTEIFASISMAFKTLARLFKSRLRGEADPLLLQVTKVTVNRFGPEA